MGRMPRAGAPGGRTWGLARVVRVTVSTSLVLAVVTVAVLALVQPRGAGSATASALPSGPLLPADSLAIGACLEMKPGSDVVQPAYPARDCNVAHDAEVFADGILPAGAFPGKLGMSELVRARCAADRAGYVWPGAAAMTTWFTYPTAAMWSSGHREYSCVAVSSTGDFAGDMSRSG